MYNTIHTGENHYKLRFDPHTAAWGKAKTPTEGVYDEFEFEPMPNGEFPGWVETK